MAEREHRSTYWVTYAALMLLLAATVAASSLLHGANATIASLAIAVAKALLVALVFMHLARRGGVTRLFAAAGLFWLALALGLTMVDYATRGRPHAERDPWSSISISGGIPTPLPDHVQRGASGTR